MGQTDGRMALFQNAPPPMAGHTKSTELHCAFIGHERQRHDLIGFSETRTVGAQRVLNARFPMRTFTLEFETGVVNEA